MFRFLMMFAGIAIVSFAVGTTDAQLGWTAFGIGIFGLGLYANKLEDDNDASK